LTLTDWITNKMILEGRDWVNKNLSEAEKDLGQKVNPDTYMVTVRKVARRIKEKTEIEDQRYKDNPAKLKTPTEMTDELKLDLTAFTVDKVVFGEYGHPDNRMGQTKVFASKDKNKFNPEEQFQKFIEEIKNNSPVVKLPKLPKRNRKCFFIQVPDLHFGKLGRLSEVGEVYNMEIATQRFMQAICVFCEDAKHHKPEKILVNLGGDILNTDNGKTTTKGTPQDEESSIADIQRKAVWLIIEGAKELAKYAPVEIIIIPGNHDEIRSWFLGHAIEMYFWNDKRITVDNREIPRKYFRFGINLLECTHGDTDKKKLPFLMAQENPKDWGETKVRECFTGHTHKNEKFVKSYIDEDSGVRVYTCPTLSGTDKWHFKEGWIGAIKEAQNHIYDFELGKIAVSICEFF
jgi:hypothetical protein